MFIRHQAHRRVVSFAAGATSLWLVGCASGQYSFVAGRDQTVDNQAPLSTTDMAPPGVLAIGGNALLPGSRASLAGAPLVVADALPPMPGPGVELATAAPSLLGQPLVNLQGARPALLGAVTPVVTDTIAPVTSLGVPVVTASTTLLTGLTTATVGVVAPAPSPAPPAPSPAPPTTPPLIPPLLSPVPGLTPLPVLIDRLTGGLLGR